MVLERRVIGDWEMRDDAVPAVVGLGEIRQADANMAARPRVGAVVEIMVGVVELRLTYLEYPD